VPVNQKRLTSTQTQHLNTARSFRCSLSYNKPLPIAYFSIYVLAFSSDYGQAMRPKHVVRQQINEIQVFKYCVCVDSTDTVFIYCNMSLFSAFAKLQKRRATSSCLFLCPSVCSHGTTRLPLEEFSRNFIFDYFSKICPKSSNFIKILQ